MAHGQQQQGPGGGSSGDRLLLPLLLPLIAAVVTAALIISIGNLLLSVQGMYAEGDVLARRAPVAVALALAVGVLLFCAALAATWGRARR